MILLNMVSQSEGIPIQQFSAQKRWWDWRPVIFRCPMRLAISNFSMHRISLSLVRIVSRSLEAAAPHSCALLFYSCISLLNFSYSHNRSLTLASLGIIRLLLLRVEHDSLDFFTSLYYASTFCLASKNTSQIFTMHQESSHSQNTLAASEQVSLYSEMSLNPLGTILPQRELSLPSRTPKETFERSLLKFLQACLTSFRAFTNSFPNDSVSLRFLNPSSQIFRRQPVNSSQYDDLLVTKPLQFSRFDSFLSLRAAVIISSDSFLFLTGISGRSSSCSSWRTTGAISFSFSFSFSILSSMGDSSGLCCSLSPLFPSGSSSDFSSLLALAEKLQQTMAPSSPSDSTSSSMVGLVSGRSTCFSGSSTPSWTRSESIF